MRKYAFQLNNAEKPARVWLLILLYSSQIPQYPLAFHIHAASSWWKKNISSKNELGICKKTSP